MGRAVQQAEICGHTQWDAEMKIRFPIENLARQSVGRDAGFGESVLATAVVKDGQIEIDSSDWSRLVLAHFNGGDARTRIEPGEPTTLELAANFAGAMARWGAAGFATVSADTYAERAAICDACEHWDGSARAGLGKCNAPGCGCTRFKRWLATERCQLGKWPVS